MSAAPPPVPERPLAADLTVYPAKEDTYLLLPFASVPPGTRVLEVGTGGGLIALAAARAGGRVVATDRNASALSQLRREALREGLPVSPVRTDLARGLGRFDRVLSNPPYLPWPEGSGEELDRGTRLALDGGPDGVRFLARLLSDLPDLLVPGGEAFVLVSTVQDPERLADLRDRWRARGGQWEPVANRRLEGEELSVCRLTLDDRPAEPDYPGRSAYRRMDSSSRCPSPNPRGEPVRVQSGYWAR